MAVNEDFQGRTYDPTPPFSVGREHIRDFAAAVGATDPVHHDVEAARAATTHLIERGRRRIAVVGVHPGEVVGSAALRVQGYEQAGDLAELFARPLRRRGLLEV